MIRVDSLKIQEFRGIRDLTLELKRKNFAVCGPNGTGKSGIVDALEFALTGNISRLSGRGMGEVSVKKHGPHVDSRDNPEKAQVTIKVWIPRLKKTAVITRTVKDPDSPTITPADPEITAVLQELSLHPEFVLSRREIIRYVLSTPGDRAKEVQELLQLSQIEELRTCFQRIANANDKEVGPLKTEKSSAIQRLLDVLQISQLSDENVLSAVNGRRSILKLSPLTTIDPDTSLKDGLVTAASTPPRVPKTQALKEIKDLRRDLESLRAPAILTLCTSVISRLRAIAEDSEATNSVKREKFLKSADELLEGNKCPVCDTPWEISDLRELIQKKLERLEEISAEITLLEKELAPLNELLVYLRESLTAVQRYGDLLDLTLKTKPLFEFARCLEAHGKQLNAVLPIPDAITSLGLVSKISEGVYEAIDSVEKAVETIPEPTEQDAARDYLSVAQERYEHYQTISVRLDKAEERARIARLANDTYLAVSTKALAAIYKQVEKEFSHLYRCINQGDEDEFDAQLVPSMGKLGFDVDFYGRGYFPPGAYHSEGHQDGMGLCLYLALMKHLLGNSFTFAVLDDVLMSIDSGHRREVCKLLCESFPDTQFILTTHDPIWLKHMKTIGLIASNGSVQFGKWNVDSGPTEWDERDIWLEIDDNLKKSDVRGAAGLLRHYLEYISAELCHRLRASVEFRADAQFQLGDLLPKATKRFSDLLLEGEKAARSWGKTDEANAIALRRSNFDAAAKYSNLDNWQINSSVHYNEWAKLDKADFAPVVVAFHELLGQFFCKNCKVPFFVVPERGQRKGLRCDCETGINLVLK